MKGCYQCDLRRASDRDQRWRIGQPCDICDDTGFSYIGTPCRHSHMATEKVTVTEVDPTEVQS